MSQSKYHVKVPGKLMIAGEYAVLEPNQHAVVIAIDRYVSVNIERSEENSFSLPQLGFECVTWRDDNGKIVFSVSDPRLRFVQNTINLMHQYLQENMIKQHSYHLTVTSDLYDPSGRKYGLGSSAAVVVAVVTAILSLYSKEGIQSSLDHIFKLSAIAHLESQGNGSGADIAASTFGGWIYYSAYRSNWIINKLKQGMKITELIDTPWPNLTITTITPPPFLKLCVGWTGEVARTAPMIKKIQEFRQNHSKLYKQFLAESSIAVANFVKSFESGKARETMLSISQNRQALIKLSEYAKIAIETSKLKKLCDLAEIYGSGKSSGAGGGDCGIAFVKGNIQTEQLYKAWENIGIEPLDLQVSKNGVIVKDIGI